MASRVGTTAQLKFSLLSRRRIMAGLCFLSALWVGDGSSHTLIQSVLGLRVLLRPLHVTGLL